MSALIGFGHASTGMFCWKRHFTRLPVGSCDFSKLKSVCFARKLINLDAIDLLIFLVLLIRLNKELLLCYRIRPRWNDYCYNISFRNSCSGRQQFKFKTLIDPIVHRHLRTIPCLKVNTTSILWKEQVNRFVSELSKRVQAKKIVLKLLRLKQKYVFSSCNFSSKLKKPF